MSDSTPIFDEEMITRTNKLFILPRNFGAQLRVIIITSLLVTWGCPIFIGFDDSFKLLTIPLADYHNFHIFIIRGNRFSIFILMDTDLLKKIIII
ncbi:MAG: hypothetical protein QQN41_06065, partial [Nitrosopumilus sp.]